MKPLKSHLIIWDYKDLFPPDISNKEVILWSQWQNKIISIQDLIENNSDNIKQKCLDWIYEIGSLKLRKTLIDFEKKLR